MTTPDEVTSSTGDKQFLDKEREEAQWAFKLAATAWLLYLILWYATQWKITKVFGVIFLLIAIFWSARLIFHSSTLWIAKLPRNQQRDVQYNVAFIAAVLPLLYFLPEKTQPLSDLLIYMASRWPYWLTTVLFGYFAYLVGTVSKPSFPFRGYLILVGIICFLAWTTKAGISFDPEEGGIIPDDPSDPITHRDAAIINYIRFIVAGYAGLTFGFRKNSVI